MIKKTIYITIVLIMMTNSVYARSDEYDKLEILSSQEETFGIKDFLSETKKYSSELLGDVEITDMFNDAIKGKIDNQTIIKKIVFLFYKQIQDVLKILVSILVIVLIHSLLKSITDGLENNEVSKIVYYVQYILIITIIMSNFTKVVVQIGDTIKQLVEFSELLIPLLITLLIYTGSITTSGLIEPVLFFLIEFIANMINTFVMPLISIITVLIILSKISSKVQINKLASFMKSTIVWALGLVLTLFVGVVSLEGSLTSAVDGITAKTTKAAVSSLIPVVGKILGDSVDAILGCGVILKNAVGILGVIVIISISIVPIIRLGTFSIIYSLTAGILEPIADEKIVKLLSEMGGIFKLLLAVLCSMSVLLIIGVTLVIKISNSGLMYR